MPKTRKRSKPSPKPAPAKPQKRRPGRPEGQGFKASDQQKELVRLASGLGIPEDDIARGTINPATKRPISHVTLRKHFRQELDEGILAVKIKGGGNLLALTATNAACAIFFAKCRLGFNERASWIPTPGHPAPGAPAANAVPFGEFQEAEVTLAEGKGMTEIARRIAWTLTMGARTPAEPEEAKGPKRTKKAVKKQPQPV